MDNLEYTSLVADGVWPEERIVPLNTPFTDSRGVIQNLVLKPLNSAVVITSAKGTVRANHYHKTDWHYCFVVSGSIDYYERPIGSTEKPKKVSIAQGQLFFTPPMVEHAMVFTSDTVFMTLAHNVRTHDLHEEDVVRVNLIDPATVEV
jgi:dTDP-4-dehydrorhamnose 3,5-epimerase-like enzyme